MKRQVVTAAALVLLLTGCVGRGMRYPGTTRHLSGSPPSHLPSMPGEPQRADRGGEMGGTQLANAISRSAEAYLGASRLRVSGQTFRYDCSGFVNAAHSAAGTSLANRNTAGMVDYARQRGVFERRGRPSVGDTVFFSNTHDRNGNNRLDDDWTHVAVVEARDADGTLHLIHLGNQGVVRMVMNLDRASDHQDSAGKELNSFLRRRTNSDRRGTKYLAGELYSGMASFWAVGGALALNELYNPEAFGEPQQLALATSSHCSIP